MSTDLPAPEDTIAAAEDAVRGTTKACSDPNVVNLVVPALAGTGFNPSDVERTENGYEGCCADNLGRLAAAATIAANSDGETCLHYPEFDGTAAGPWLVVEPLGGQLSTVHAGRGVVHVALEPPKSGGGVDTRLVDVQDRIAAVLEAARPICDHYPVTADEQGVFTTGMTTFSLTDIVVKDNRMDVVLDVATTPATMARTVEDRFELCESVLWVEYESQVGTERAVPSRDLRRAAEAATETIRGDWEYEWFPEPTQFSQIPAPEKLALGVSGPGSDSCAKNAYAQTVELLRETIDRYRGEW